MVVRRGLQWIYNKIVAKAQQCILAVLAAGPVPQHIAFVMDGNRRYARSHNKKIQQGHSEGFVALHKILDVCLHMNIHCVSVYAFSIENFKRPREEVDALMALMEEKLLELCSKGDLLDEYGVRLNIIGRVELLPKNVQRAVRKAEKTTRHNNRAILNICVPYTSRDEMTTAVEETVRAGLAFRIDPDTFFTKEEVDRRIMTTARGSPPLDILVRTSGVQRLSDYLLWQCCENTQIQFTPTYWPNFGLFDFIPIILDYQRKIWSRRISG
ncbi:Di-trans-poly-cis-decaprenylcistransferase [Macrolepiota fuliginosa MF-IS2]|uniref:Alkyl transferase n=1 Tax=Macrolepiota fuliginosa MF-IS2 TaxID=1400762 RepID=A0A9P6C3M4_9AGAR|nr:Di-trans-poly-cis-decaprenylcistransferase [Macrolepiota fuliginosa MF-IS2]